MKKLLSALLCASMLFALTACGQKTPTDTTNPNGSTPEAVAWPTTSQVELVVPYKAGGDTDLYCRAIADALSEKLGVTFVVSNVTGAGAMNAAVDVLEGPTDGSKFLFGHNTYLAATAAGTAAVYVTTEMKPAGAIVADRSLCIYATKASGFTCMQDVIDACNAGQEVRISTVANTYPNYCIREMIAAAGVDIRCIETGSTVGEQVIAAMDGQAELIQGQYIAVRDYVENGDFNVIGVFTDELPAGMEDLQTFASQGIDVVEPKYYCFWASPDTDDAIVEAFSAALEDIQNDEALAELLASYYAEVGYMTPAEMQTMEDNTVAQMKEYFAAN
mgnify:CR=1 FL=1